ncbi:nitrate- and nitrite sensing domain-containing protein [Streptomyces sp. TLI_171]|uniref:sensor histidine kinase n=1 Tax=Streptomyces sp. TLI_171 TaxID=1938859 RepID=UPI000C1A1EED|nr:nitrate- and nitrite sensing domain-containing protein [Streptomyces sp. TLI_171]RKE22410.1 signal transduction histidine kinase [Streptomyces sp. TLI_171]
MRASRGTSRSGPPAPSTPRGPARTRPGAPRRGAHAGPPADETPPAFAATRYQRPGLRPRTVRARIVAVLMVPVVSVMALWAFATVTTAGDVWDLLRIKNVDATLRAPLDRTVAALQAERTAAGQLLAAPGPDREAELRTAAQQTDLAAAPLTLAPGYNRADAEGLGAEAATRLDTLGRAVAALPALRQHLLDRTVPWTDAYTVYTGAVDDALAATGSLTGLQDHRVAADARVLLEFARSREQLAREDALLRAAARAGQLEAAQYRAVLQAAYARAQFEQTSAADLRPADRAALAAVTGGPEYQEVRRYEEAASNAADPRAALAAVPATRWAAAADATARALAGVEQQAGAAAAERANPYALGLFTTSGVTVLLGLLAVLASLLISVQIGRGLVAELQALRNSALELAGRKLPATMRRLRSGEEVDVDTEVPPREHGADEIGQVHGALDSVQRAAVTAAVERAEVLSGVSGVFVNLARRSQVLVHRQLTLLDAMERRTEDPAELDDLFKLDHLTTRMRRHAEGLIILSGAAPGRAWRKPVPLTDVVRAAVAEVEEYARVDVHRLPYAAVTGPAVADLTHLFAELVENATGFSPPHTKVQIRGEQVGNGYAVEIEDRGLGMGPEALGDANRRIAASEQVDLFDSDRLGLFVVSRLAKRHGVKVALRPSAYGGTTAVVLLPTDMLDLRYPEPAQPERASAFVPDRPAERPAVGRSAPERPMVERAPVEPSAPERPRVERTAIVRPLSVLPAQSTPAAAPAPPPSSAPSPLPLPAAPVQALPSLVAPADSEDELPRRVRQASLAPQLRETPEPAGAGLRPAAPADRDPEQARTAMSAFQQGWARGAAAGPEPGPHPRPRTDAFDFDFDLDRGDRAR